MHRSSGFAILIPLALASIVAAQPRGGGFRVPRAGEMLPEVTVFDEQGRESRSEAGAFHGWNAQHARAQRTASRGARDRQGNARIGPFGGVADLGERTTQPWS